MAWTGLVLTVEGRNALNQAQLSNRINFKSIVVGDGAAPINFRTLKGLVHQLYEITNIKVDLTEGGCTLTADFPKVEYDYYFREIGIIVTTDEGDKLYAYDNCGEDAQYMVSSTGVETTKKRIRLALTISDVAEITVSAAEILYVAYDDYEKTVEVLKQSLEEENERAKGAEKSLSEKLQEEKERAEAAEGILTENLQKEVIRAKEAEETNKNNLTAHVADKANPHKVTKVQVGLGNVDNTADVNKPVSAYQQNAIDSAYQQATGYTDRKIADLIGGAPETLDTLKEVADAIQANKDVSEALDEAIGKKANQTELDTHTGNNTIHITSQERTNWNDANTKKHTHSNKSVLDKITQALLDSWNTAYTHISDAVKHVTAAERTLWNTVSNKVDKVSGKGLSTNDYTTA
ncbi:MAG: phage tail protein, partial [Lachnospiraceae bacterium]